MKPAERARLIARYEEGPTVLEASLAGLSQEELDFRHGPEEWTPREIVHHTAEHPSAYGVFGGGREGWLVVSQASRCLISVYGPYATREEAREEVRRDKARAEARAEAYRRAAR